MFRIKVFSTMALAAALGLAAFSSPALARGPIGRLAGGVLPYRVPGIGLGGYSLGGYGGVLPYRVPGAYGLGGYSLGGYGGYGQGFYGSGYGLGAYNLSGGGYSYYGLPGSYGIGGYGLGYGGYGLGLRYGLGRSYLGIGVGNPGYYYGGAGTYLPSYNISGQGYPYSPRQPYGYDPPYGNGVDNYGGANPDFRQSGYGPPPNGPDPAREETDVAHLQVVMPAANAQLWVNDTRTRQQGTSRAFVSPSLKPGKRFAYELRARWTDRSGRAIEETRSITVQAGDRQVVDFTQPPADGRQPAPDRLEEPPPAPQDQPPPPRDRPVPQDRQPLPPDRPAPQDQPPPVPPAPQDRPER